MLRFSQEFWTHSNSETGQKKWCAVASRLESNSALLDFRSMSDREKRQLVQEVNILRDIKHDNIVRYYEREVDKDNCRIFIITEYCEGGDLAGLIKRCKKEGYVCYPRRSLPALLTFYCHCFRKMMNEDAIWNFFAQLVFALHACHTGEMIPNVHTSPGKSASHTILHR